MHQSIALAIAILAIVFLLGPEAAYMASIGNWGGGLGLLLGPLFFFYLVTAIVYFPARLLRGRDKVAGFARTRLQYVGQRAAAL